MKKQYETNSRAHQNVLNNNASTMGEMESTIQQLKNQLQTALITKVWFKKLPFIAPLMTCIERKNLTVSFPRSANHRSRIWFCAQDNMKH